jgi:hypothetical protein
MRRRVLAAAVGTVFAVGLPASATPPPEMPKASERELYCIANGLEHANAMGDVVAALRGSNDGGKGQAALDAATNTCRAQYGWTDARMGLAQLMATYIAMKSAAEEDIYAVYESDDDSPQEMAMNLWQPVADEMPDATEDLLRQGGQLHPDVVSRLRDMFNEAGLLGSDSYYFSTVMGWMQANAAENAARKRWMSEAS